MKESHYIPENFTNILNGKRYLILERRGCEMRKDDPDTYKSDVGNHRVFVCFKSADNGDIICGDFVHCARYRMYSLRNCKKTGKPRMLVNPVYMDNMGLHADLSFTGAVFRYGELVRGSWRVDPQMRWGIEHGDYLFMKEDILSFVNRVSEIQYDKIVIAKHPKWDDLGNRERAILNKLERTEVVQDSNGYLVVRFWHENEEDFFDVEQNSMRITG